MTFYVGGTVPLAQLFTNDQGNGVNPATVTLTITLPDGVTTITPPVPNPPPGQTQVGLFEFPYEPPTPGRYQYQWTSTSPDRAWPPDVFNVGPAATSLAILGLAEAKTALGISLADTSDDLELLDKLQAVTQGIEKYKHEVIAPRQFTEEHFFGGLWGQRWPMTGYSLRLWQVPVIQMQSLTSLQPGLAGWDPSNFYVDNGTGLVYLLTGPPVRGRVQAVYTAGYQQIPQNYIEGAKVFLQHLWEVRRGPGGLSGVIGPEELGDWRHADTLPRKVTTWLGPPRPVVA